MKWNFRMGAWALTLQISLQKLCMLSVMRRDINTSFLYQYWITRYVGIPYLWRIKMWLYVGEVRIERPQKVDTCVSNGRMGQQHRRDYQTSRNPIPFRLQSTHVDRGLSTSFSLIGRWLMCLRNEKQLSQPLKVQHHGWFKKIKFGIRVPQTVIEALRRDKNNGNHICRDRIAKEINSVMIAFKLLD